MQEGKEVRSTSFLRDSRQNKKVVQKSKKKVKSQEEKINFKGKTGNSARGVFVRRDALHTDQKNKKHKNWTKEDWRRALGREKKPKNSASEERIKSRQSRQ